MSIRIAPVMICDKLEMSESHRALKQVGEASCQSEIPSPLQMERCRVSSVERASLPKHGDQHFHNDTVGNDR